MKPKSLLTRGRIHHVAAALCVLAAAVLSPATAGALPARVARTSHGKAAGPSLSVIGWGVNRLFVPKGTTVKSSTKCEELVASNSGTPIGPPQQIYLTVYVEASNIPNHAPIQIKDELPERWEEVSIREFSEPVPFSRVLSKGSSIGAPADATKNLYYGGILSESAEAGEYEGPSAEEFDGTYSYTASVKVGPHTLTSTAKVTVDCPQLR